MSTQSASFVSWCSVARFTITCVCVCMFEGPLQFVNEGGIQAFSIMARKLIC